MEVIKIATLHLEAEAQDWWFHGLSTLGHANVIAYSNFTRMLVERSDQRDPQAPFMGLENLRQSCNLETYIFEFLKLSIMVVDLSAVRRGYMFIDGIEKPLHGLVEYTKPTTLQYAIERAIDLQDALPKAKAKCQQKPTFLSKRKYDKAPFSKESQKKLLLSDDVKIYLRRRNIFFAWQESWAPGNICAAGKAHYIEVFLDDEDDEEE